MPRRPAKSKPKVRPEVVPPSGPGPTALKSLSIPDLAATPAAALRDLRASKRPQYLTHHGKKAAVVLDPVTYRKLLRDADEAELRRSLDRSFDQMERGEYKPLRTAIAEVRAEIRARFSRKRKGA